LIWETARGVREIGGLFGIENILTST
jgi:hypothetical protein